MEIQQTELSGVLLIKPDIFEDHRGEYVMLYNKKFFKKTQFLEDDISVSYKNVLRGIHGDDKTSKLISCLYGRFYLVIVNNDETSEQYHQWEALTLSDKNRWQVLVPPKFGNGHLVLSDVAIFHYKQTQYYDRESQFTIAWNDPKLGIFWPTVNPIVSERDNVFRPYGSS